MTPLWLAKFVRAWRGPLGPTLKAWSALLVAGWVPMATFMVWFKPPTVGDAPVPLVVAIFSVAVLIGGAFVLVPRRPTRKNKLSLVAAAVLTLTIAALLAMWYYKQLDRYRYLDSAGQPHISGELHPDKEATRDGMSIEQLVRRHGGHRDVERFESLWSKESQRHVSRWLEWLHAAVGVLLAAGMAVVSALVARQFPPSAGESTEGKPK